MEAVFETPVELALRLRPNDLAPALARHALAGVRARLGDDLTDDAEVLLSELVTNSVRHRPPTDQTDIDVTVAVARHRLRAEVSDANGFRWDLVARPIGPEQGGFGFVLLTGLAHRWGVETGPPTKVWFEIDRQIEVSGADEGGMRPAPELELSVREVRRTVKG
jgi:anti-sigma regulatory factor (Ser/Thr protein kinase)